ncbi:MAG TPA: class II aldolase/adducin family protein [Burkholderiales bacterium]|jgi:ribulose-5-phosphate 4-epimerase/fuculose-1-phosphate aldolase|nr:class II aldolase/adducin family protein [Burkholderiales bacterium]
MEVRFDPEVGRTLLKYARLLSARGYIHNTLGNIVLRVPHPDFPHGVAYTKHAELSLEEMELDNIVITDIPTSRILHGSKVTSIGHNLSREILRLRPDIQATIHVHDDAMIAYFGSGAFDEVKTLSLDLPFVLGKPIHYVPGHVDVEADVSGVKDFIQNTNSVVLLGHGITTLGRNVSEAYHRLNSLTAEIRRNVAAELLALAKGTKPQYRGQAEIESMYRFAESIIYPKRADRVMQED